MRPIGTVAWAFRLGWEWGNRNTTEASISQAEGILPLYFERSTENLVAAFCQGSVDGCRGDRFRLNHPEASRAT